MRYLEDEYFARAHAFCINISFTLQFMDRTPYHLPFAADRVPLWRCPCCHAGHLTLDPKNLVFKETAVSVGERERDDWEPSWIRYVYSCVFQCSNSSCKEWISSCGSGSVNLVEYEDQEFGWVQTTEESFTPRYFEPSLVLMDLPDKCPMDARAHLNEAFSLYFADPGAAMNCARTAVEAIVTDLGVKRFATSNGKQRLINLHQRILLLPPKYKDVVDLLLAVKWLGNAGSHDGERPEAGDLRVTVDLLEHVLSELYEEKGKRLKAIAKKVNKKKGLVK